MTKICTSLDFIQMYRENLFSLCFICMKSAKESLCSTEHLLEKLLRFIENSRKLQNFSISLNFCCLRCQWRPEEMFYKIEWFLLCKTYWHTFQELIFKFLGNHSCPIICCDFSDLYVIHNHEDTS